MTAQAVPLAAGMGLLERAVGYALGGLALVDPGALAVPTPCRDWDLGTLLRHLAGSLSELRQAIDPEPQPPGSGWDPGSPVAGLRGQARLLLGACTRPGRDLTFVEGCPVPLPIVACAGAIEIAVHGWDVAWACGRRRPLPTALAAELLDLAPLLVTSADRPSRFAAPVRLPAGAGPADQLLAFLGRNPR